MRHRFFAETLSKNALVEVSWTFRLTFLFWKVMEISRRKRGEKDEEMEGTESQLHREQSLKPSIT